MRIVDVRGVNLNSEGWGGDIPHEDFFFGRRIFRGSVRGSCERNSSAYVITSDETKVNSMMYMKTHME